MNGAAFGTGLRVRSFWVIRIRISDPDPDHPKETQPYGLFTWREGAPANRATRLEGLTHSSRLHATHLTETVSEMCGLSFERPLSTTNKMADRRNVLATS